MTSRRKKNTDLKPGTVDLAGGPWRPVSADRPNLASLAIRNLISAAGLAFLAAVAVSPLVAQVSQASQACLDCHGEAEMREATFDFKNGTSVPVFVGSTLFARSVHGEFDCSDCHQRFSEEEHAELSFSSRTRYRRSMSEGCRSCHELAGIHERMLRERPRLDCVGCHGSHAIVPIDTAADNCLGCHQRDLKTRFADKTQLSLFFDKEAFQLSVHQKLRCVDCHFGFSSEKHPERVFHDHRELTLAMAESCRRCHFDKYTRTLESVHFKILSQEDQRVPVCTDCHGSHAIGSARHDKLAAARRCKNCHEDIYRTFSQSVHGKPLLSEDNQDVPVCSDCHTAHKIQDPTRADFRDDIPQMCGDCHSNKQLMSKYGLSTAVLETYLESFHGVTLSFYKKEHQVRRIAVCTDCHGIHDIQSLRGRDDATVKATLVGRCRQCHQEATINFPAAWISHYEPNLERAPLVFLVRLFYRVFIPFMIVGLVVQILLDIWRYASNR
ncbi:MAG: cytochrome c3 family protein [Acidobacteriota bacterium]